MIAHKLSYAMVGNVIVVDTNVYVGAMKGAGGANRRIVRLCLEERIVPLMGAALFAEYEDLMTRDDLFAGCPLDRSERDDLLDAFLSVCRWTPIYYLWRPNLRDEADNHVVELAVAGGARVIVTHNVRDFAGDLMEPLGLEAMTPEAYLKAMEEDR